APAIIGASLQNNFQATSPTQASLLDLPAATTYLTVGSHEAKHFSPHANRHARTDTEACPNAFADSLVHRAEFSRSGQPRWHSQSQPVPPLCVQRVTWPCTD